MPTVRCSSLSLLHLHFQLPPLSPPASLPVVLSTTSSSSTTIPTRPPHIQYAPKPGCVAPSPSSVWSCFGDSACVLTNEVHNCEYSWQGISSTLNCTVACCKSLIPICTHACSHGILWTWTFHDHVSMCEIQVCSFSICRSACKLLYLNHSTYSFDRQTKRSSRTCFGTIRPSDRAPSHL